jgi:hypothetical protein
VRISGQTLLKDISREDLEEIISENPSLRGYLQGYIAEIQLKKKLSTLPGVTSITKIPDRDSRRGDLLMSYKGIELTVEVKCLSALAIKENFLDGGHEGVISLKNSDRKHIGEGAHTCCLSRGEFDILAVCTFAVTQEWTFLFIENQYLPSSKFYPERLLSKIKINTQNTPLLHADPVVVLDSVFGLKSEHAVNL